jgi:hypothetical protein
MANIPAAEGARGLPHGRGRGLLEARGGGGERAARGARREREAEEGEQTESGGHLYDGQEACFGSIERSFASGQFLEV